MANQSEIDQSNFVHFVRAALALVLTATLPVLLWVGGVGSADVVQAYRDALAAAVAFYFGTTAQPAD